MPKSPLPLILGAGAALLILSKRGGGTVSVENIEVINDQSAFDALAAREAELTEKYDTMSIIGSTVEGLSAQQVAQICVPMAQAHPEVLFLVMTDALFVNLGVPQEAMIPGLVVAAVTEMDPASGRVGHHQSEGVTAQNAASKIPAAFNFAKKDFDQQASQGSAGVGNRQLAGAGPTMANATGGSRRTLASQVGTRTQGPLDRLLSNIRVS